jgi:hypothetical protein
MYKLGIAIGNNDLLDWLELGLSAVADADLIKISPDTPLTELNLYIIDADEPGRGFLTFYKNHARQHGACQMVVLGQPSSPAMMAVDWFEGDAIFISKPAQISDVVHTVKARLQALKEKKESEASVPPAVDGDGKGTRSLGYLSTLKLADLIQMLCLNGWTGKIEINNLTTDEAGEIYLNAGLLTHAKMGQDSGKEACYHMLVWGRCRFDFIEEHPLVVKNIDASWEEVLLEGARRLDERAAAGA